MDLFAVQGTQKSSPTPKFKSISSLVLSFLHSPTLTSIHQDARAPSGPPPDLKARSRHPGLARLWAPAGRLPAPCPACRPAGDRVSRGSWRLRHHRRVPGRHVPPRHPRGSSGFRLSHPEPGTCGGFLETKSFIQQKGLISVLPQDETLRGLSGQAGLPPAQASPQPRLLPLRRPRHPGPGGPG